MIGDILQPTHLLFVLVVALLVLGPKRLPEAGRALGKGIRDFRMAIGGEEPDHGKISSHATDLAPPPPAVAPPATEPTAAPTTVESPTAEPEAVDAESVTQPTEPAQPVG